MNILVTGAKGFIGKNLLSQLRNIHDGKAKNYAVEGNLTLYEYDLDSTPEELDLYCKNADFVFNLAGVNRPQDPVEFMKGNFGFASTLLDTLKKHGNTCPVMISSSIQAALDNPYGESKRAGEQLLFDYAKETGAKVLVYRFPNLFGKWCRPNYNSAVATFCNNIANDLPITVNDPSVELHLVYIDDVVDELVDRYGDPPRAVNNLVSIALLRSQAAQCGFTDISQKGLVLTFSMKEFELQKIAALSGVARFKGRILFSPGKDSSALSLRLKPGEDVLAAGRRLVETYRQLLEQKQEA